MAKPHRLSKRKDGGDENQTLSQEFEREFHGDTIHPAVMEILDEFGQVLPGLEPALSRVPSSHSIH